MHFPIRISWQSGRNRALSAGNRAGLARLSEAEINTLMATAAVVVFPSYYEGFGLPVVHGLAHARTVVVRQSPLWTEIAAHADLPGTLVPVDDEIGLVEAVGRALHGVPAAGLAFRGAIADGRSAPSWRDCAQRIIELVRDLCFGHDASRWIEREVILDGSLSPQGEDDHACPRHCCAPRRYELSECARRA